MIALAALLAAVVGPSSPAEAQGRNQNDRAPELTLLTVEALEASRLLDSLLPAFRKQTGVRVQVVARNAATIVRMAHEGDADVILIDDRVAAEQLVADGTAIELQDVMYSEMVVAGPRGDPAGVGGMISVIDAFRAILRSESNFISRGDESGLHRAERSFWTEVGVLPSPASSRWYSVTEADMRTTLGLAVAKNSYTLTDRATWLGLRNRKETSILVAHDPRLQLRFGVMILDPAKFPDVKEKAARALAAWLTSKEAQDIIAGFEIEGEIPYMPDRGLNR